MREELKCETQEEKKTKKTPKENEGALDGTGGVRDDPRTPSGGLPVTAGRPVHPYYHRRSCSILENCRSA